MGYGTISLDDLDALDVDDVEPTLLSVGYALQPDEMRPNVWRFEAGEATNDHRHADQEELYVVLDGRFEVTVGGDELELSEGDHMVVDPDTWRELTATEEATLLVVGAPPIEGDAEVR